MRAVAWCNLYPMVGQPKNINWVKRTDALRQGLTTALVSLCLAGNAWAKLGGDLASVQSDQQAWSAAATQTSLAGATLVTQTLPNGLTVRQFLDPAGLVFAVAWEGPVLPDFARLLGPHFTAYTNALPKQRRGVNLHDGTIVIESGGMMRSYAGRAYLPVRLPLGWSVNDIR